MLPNIHVICLESKFAERGAVTLAFLASNIDKNLYGTLQKFKAVTPNDFDVDAVASAQQVAIIKGRRGRVEHADMSSKAQAACALSHVSLWQLCAESNHPIVVVEDDVHPHDMSIRLREAFRLKGDVVLLCCAKLVRNDKTKQVSSFVATGAYYLTPSGANKLLKHVFPVAMHVDYYMSACIATYNLEVFGVDNSDDQWNMPSSKLSTLEHTKTLFDIKVPRLVFVVCTLATLLAVLFLAFFGAGLVILHKHRSVHYVR